MMLELKEKVFARLDKFGFEEVQVRLDRGEHLGDAQIVREWLELQAQAPPQIPVASDISFRQRR